MELAMNESRTKMWWMATGLGTAGLLAVSLAAQQSMSLVITGQQGTAKVVQVQGHNYVDIDGLARLTNGTISFKGEQIVLSLPLATVPSNGGTQPTGLSKEFLSAAVEAMARVREWHSALRTAIERGVPLTTGWLDAYQEQAQQGLNVASVAISTDADKRGYQVMVNAFNLMKSLNDKYVQLNKSLIYFAPDSLQSDPLDQRIVACGHSLSAMAASRQYVEDGACQ
jgi:hypothetical protein